MKGSMDSSRCLCAALVGGWMLAASACSNLTSPAGEDPDSLPPVGDHAAAPTPPSQPKLLPNKPEPKNAKDEEAMIRRILIAYEGAEGAKPGVKRSKEQAQKLAVQIAGDIRQRKEDFAALAKKHSDAPDAARGGLLPGIKRESKLDPTLKSAAFQTRVGQTSGVLNTKQGYLILQRLR